LPSLGPYRRSARLSVRYTTVRRKDQPYRPEASRHAGACRSARGFWSRWAAPTP